MEPVPKVSFTTQSFADLGAEAVRLAIGAGDRRQAPKKQRAHTLRCAA